MEQVDLHNKVSVSELRRMLFELKALRPDIHIRFRLIGELWQPLYCQVALLTDKGVALNNADRKLLIIPDLKDVMQFELEQVFQKYQPHFHYTIDLENSSSIQDVSRNSSVL
jgi:hypothetical protein